MIPPRPIVKVFWLAHRKAFDFSKGKLGSRMLGFPALGLYTRGRKSGLERLAVLLYLEDSGRYAVVGSNLGSDTTPAWWLNLRADPNASLLIRGQRHQVVAAEATKEEYDRLFPRFVEKLSDYAEYRRRTTRQIPVVLLTPTDAAGSDH